MFSNQNECVISPLNLNSNSFKYVDLNAIIPELLCWICKKPAYEAKIHGPCGLLQCNGCVSSTENHENCVNDPLTGWYDCTALYKKMLDELQVECINEKCEVIMKRVELIAHVKDECKYKTITCKRCQQEIQESDWVNHDKQTCPMNGNDVKNNVTITEFKPKLSLTINSSSSFHLHPYYKIQDASLYTSRKIKDIIRNFTPEYQTKNIFLYHNSNLLTDDESKTIGQYDFSLDSELIVCFPTGYWLGYLNLIIHTDKDHWLGWRLDRLFKSTIKISELKIELFECYKQYLQKNLQNFEIKSMEIRSLYNSFILKDDNKTLAEYGIYARDTLSIWINTTDIEAEKQFLKLIQENKKKLSSGLSGNVKQFYTVVVRFPSDSRSHEILQIRSDTPIKNIKTMILTELDKPIDTYFKLTSVYHKNKLLQDETKPVADYAIQHNVYVDVIIASTKNWVESITIGIINSENISLLPPNELKVNSKTTIDQLKLLIIIEILNKSIYCKYDDVMLPSQILSLNSFIFLEGNKTLSEYGIEPKAHLVLKAPFRMTCKVFKACSYKFTDNQFNLLKARCIALHRDLKHISLSEIQKLLLRNTEKEFCCQLYLRETSPLVMLSDNNNNQKSPTVQNASNDNRVDDNHKRKSPPVIESLDDQKKIKIIID